MILDLSDVDKVYFNGTSITRINFNGTNVWTGGGSPSAPKIQYGRYGTSTSSRAQIVQTAMSLQGSPYAYGATGPNAFDNNGFVYYLYSQVGIGLPRQNTAVYAACEILTIANVNPGDIFFLFGSSGPSTIGIYTGSNSGIWCTSSSGMVSPVDLTLYM